MSEILREKQKAEALKRMRLIGLREDFIRDFEKDGISAPSRRPTPSSARRTRRWSGSLSRSITRWST